MKLIDADATIDAFHQFMDEDYEWKTNDIDRGVNWCANKILYDIPTVKAIPVEWIQKWFEHLEMYRVTMRMGINYDSSVFAQSLLEIMIEDWKNEAQ